MEKVAIIEMNESDVKLVVLDVAQGIYFNKFEKIVENIKLGKVIREEGLISATKVAETLTTLKLYRQICDNYGVSKVVAVCTSFIKDAKNQKSFFDEIYNNTTFSFSILSKDEEIKAVYAGVINYTDVPKGVIIDVEQNEVHILQYNRRMIIYQTTLPYGAFTFVNDGLNLDQIISKVKEDIKADEYLANSLEEDTVFVGTGSNFISIGKLAKRASHYPLDIDNNYVVEKEVFDAVYDKVRDLDLDKTQKLRGISEDRADTLASGFAITKAIMEALHISNISVCAGGLEHGLIYNYLTPENFERPFSDMLAFSLDTIRAFYDRNMSNTNNVYELAVTLFKQLKVMHKLSRVYVKPLRIAASMYDCGTRVNFENYSNYSFDIIVNSRINGVSHKDLLLAGFACKLQNLDNFVLTDWVKYKDLLTEEDLDAVRKLGVIIRLAAELDKSRSGNVEDICCDILGDSIIMKTVVKGDATFDIKQGMKVGSDFKKILKKYLQII